jgi:alanyl-tRNA synthetase
MLSREVRKTFLDFFIENGHLQLPSSSLVPPAGDKTVLLTTAGMQQMTPFFLGLQTPPRNRLTTAQKCFRTVDIDEVGDPSHLTFFEMMGNFSVGDYFKEGAIEFAWKLLTERYKIPEEKLFPSIYPTDDEARQLWVKKIGVPESRITPIQDNWWGPVGATGPCGPDSEIYYDLGPEVDPDPNAVVGVSPRYLEIWNLVFMQYNRNAEGQDIPLPRKNIDTGMGLERVSMVLQGKLTVHETDAFMPITLKAAEISGKKYGVSEKDDFSMRVISDHSRAATFLIADGVLPGNEERSYILRRILRRAIRHGRLLGLDKPFMRLTCQVVMDELGPFYPEIIERQDHIFRVLEREEESFGRTLQSGLNRFELLIGANPLNASQSNKLQDTGPEVGSEDEGELLISGKDVFDLFSTHGFPPDLTRELASERGFKIDWEGFKEAEEEHKKASTSLERFQTSRPDMEEYKALNLQVTPFKGYEGTQFKAPVIAVFVNGKRVPQAEAGQDAEVVLSETPFYVESGGQVSDQGFIQTETGRFTVENTYKPVGDVIVHQGRVAEGYITTGEEAEAVVEEDRRLDTARNHTGTHILHQALKDVLGKTVGQAGSLVAPDRLRFDFTYPGQPNEEQLREIERIVNDKVRANLEVKVEVLPLEEAKKSGAVMMFGEKYGDPVRVLSVGDYSKELCGGTHLRNSGQIGLMVITNESSIGSGLRRVEAVTGRYAEKLVQERLQLLNRTSEALQVRPEAVADEAAKLRARVRELERELAQVRQKQAQNESTDLLNRAQEVDGVKVLAAKVNAPNIDILRSVGDRLRDGLKSGVLAIGAVINEKPNLLVMVTPDLVDKGLKAGDLIRPIAAAVGGKAGGRPNMAQGGGSDPSKLDEALNLTPDLVREALSK